MKTTTKKCSHCGSQEGSKRPIGNYDVVLRELEINGKTDLVCQSCYLNKHSELNTKNKKESNMKNTLINRLKNIFFSTTAFLIFSIAELNAQGLPGPPGFPDDPAPAPIDGGLGLLAAAGGAYAWKKLRDKKNEENLE